MRLQIQTKSLALTERTRSHIQKRADHAFDRVSERISDVIFRLADVNGPKGGEDQVCQLEVRMMSGRTILVRETDSSLLTGVDRACNKAKRLVKEQIKKDTAHRQSRESIRRPGALEAFELQTEIAAGGR